MARRKLRWFQFRLRTILALVILTAVALGAWHAFVRPYEIQRALIARIKDAGGIVESRRAPTWLTSIPGYGDCRQITLVNLADIDPSDSLLAGVSRLPELEVLLWGGRTINDDSMRFIPKCESLEAVVLDSSVVSREMMARLQSARPGVRYVRTDRRLAREFPSPVIREISYDTTVQASPLVDRVGKDVFCKATVLEVRGIGVLEDQIDAQLNWALSSMHDLRSLTLSSELFVGSRLFEMFVNLRLDVEPEFRYFNAAQLAALHSLEELSLNTIPVTDADVRQLAHLRNLRSLDLSSTNVSDPASWPDFPLERLVLNDTFIENDDLPGIAKYEQLRTVSLNDTEVTDAGIASLLPLENLETLALRGARITQASYENLCLFPQLKEVSLGMIYKQSNGHLGSRWLAALGPEVVTAELTAFDTETYRPDPFATAMKRQELREMVNAAVESDGDLDLAYDNVLYALHTDLLANQAGITSLRLACSIDDELEVLSTMPDLRSLVLLDSFVTDAGLKHLAKCSQLQSLYLGGTCVTDAGMSEVAKMTSLKDLTLPRQRIRGSGMRELMKLPQLRVLQFEGSGAGAARTRCAPPLTMDDVASYRAMARLLHDRFDADADGTVTLEEIDRFWKSVESDSVIPNRERLYLFSNVEKITYGNHGELEIERSVATPESIASKWLLDQRVSSAVLEDMPGLRAAKQAEFDRLRETLNVFK